MGYPYSDLSFASDASPTAPPAALLATNIPSEILAAHQAFLATNLASLLSSKERAAAKVKVLKQFIQLGFPSVELFKEFLEKANVDPEAVQIGEEIAKESLLRRFSKGLAPHPIAALPSSTEFNSTVRIDLFFFENTVCCHMVDSHSRFSAGSTMVDKSGLTTAATVLESWFAVHGPPARMVADLGKEFDNTSLQRLCDVYSVSLQPIPVGAHWAHGVMEIRHRVVCAIMSRLRLEFPEARVHTLFLMSMLASNCLHSNKGFSPFQLVRGRNPAMPALRDVTLAEPPVGSPAETIAVLHRAREVFLQIEAREIYLRAANANTRRSTEDVVVGQLVDYWMKPEKKHQQALGWRGPAKVVGIEGPLVYARHGLHMVRTTQPLLRPHLDLRDLDSRDPVDLPIPAAAPPAAPHVPAAPAVPVIPAAPAAPAVRADDDEAVDETPGLIPDSNDDEPPAVPSPHPDPAHTSSVAGRFLPGPRDHSDWMVIREEFLELHDTWGPWTINMFTDRKRENLYPEIPLGYDVTQNGCVQKLAGEAVFFNPPFYTKIIKECLEWLLSEFAKAPKTSTFIGVLPAWVLKDLPDLISRFTILKTVPENTMFFKATGHRRIKPCHFSVLVVGIGMENQKLRRSKLSTPWPPVRSPPPAEHPEHINADDPRLGVAPEVGEGDDPPSPSPPPPVMPVAPQRPVPPVRPLPPVAAAHHRGPEWKGETVSAHTRSAPTAHQKQVQRLQHLARALQGANEDQDIALLCLNSPLMPGEATDTEFEKVYNDTSYSSFVSAAKTRKRTELKGAITKTPRFQEAKQVELRALQHYNVYRTVPRTPSMNIYSSRFVLAKKKGLTAGAPMRAKARLVVQNFCRQGSPHGANKHNLGCFAPTTARSSFKLLLSVIVNLGWWPKTIDVRVAFL